MQDSTFVQQLGELTVGTMSEAIQFVKNVAPNVWEMLVTQQYVHAYMWFAALGTGLLLMGIGALCGRAAEWDEYAQGVKAVVLTIGYAGLTLGGIMGLFSLIGILGEAVPRLLNPEYYALMQLLPD